MSASERPAPPGETPRLIALIVASALFMQNLDSSVVATALPAMARDLGAPPAHLSSAITAYLVALTVFIPVSGWIADRFGAKRVFMVAIVVFTFASVLCALSGSVQALVAARILQGMGGAMMVPVGRLLLIRRVTKAQMLSAMTWLTMPALLGPISGPPVGGFLTDAFGWQSVFLINVPVGLLGLALSAWKIPASPPDAAVARPDITGLAQTGAALALVMVGLETIGRGLLPNPWPVVTLLAGIICGVVAVRRCLRVAQPAIDFRLLAIPTFRVPVIAGSVFRAGAGATPFLVPLLLQTVFGYSASESGMLSFATALGALTMKPMTRLILGRWGFRTALTVNAVLAGGSVALGAAYTPAWPVPVIFITLALGGLCRSFQFTSMNALVFADIPVDRLSAATSFSSTFQQLTMALGVVLASGALQASAALHGHEAAGAADFVVAFLVAGLVMAASAPSFARLSPDAGQEVARHRVAPKREGPT